MKAPWWLPHGLAVIMLVIAAYCAIRPVAARRLSRPAQRDVDAAHVLMGVAMAAMLVPRLDPLRTCAWAVAFAAASAWFAVRVLRDRRIRLAPLNLATQPGQPGGRPDASPGHHLAHLLSCGSMLFMLLAAPAAGAPVAPAQAMLSAPAGAGPAGPAAAARPTWALIALVLAVAMAGSVVLTTDRLAVIAPGRSALPAPAGPRAPAQVRPHAPVLCPRLAASCQIVMGITMVYMLVQML